jgi:hypothetical protein
MRISFSKTRAEPLRVLLPSQREIAMQPRKIIRFTASHIYGRLRIFLGTYFARGTLYSIGGRVRAAVAASVLPWEVYFFLPPESILICNSRGASATSSATRPRFRHPAGRSTGDHPPVSAFHHPGELRFFLQPRFPLLALVVGCREIMLLAPAASGAAGARIAAQGRLCSADDALQSFTRDPRVTQENLSYE